MLPDCGGMVWLLGLGEEVFLEGVVAGVAFHGALLSFEVGLQTLRTKA